MRIRNLVGPLVREPFQLWRHPCGGNGEVFGWEVKRPEEDGTYDPRNLFNPLVGQTRWKWQDSHQSMVIAVDLVRCEWPNQFGSGH